MWRGFLLTAVVSLAAAADPASIARGKYLVEEVAQCGQCHTPKDDQGRLDRTRWLKGATLEVQPIGTIKNWHKTAPDLTPGSSLWKKWGEAAMLKYLETGLTPKGTLAGPPMPAYKLKREDAEAVIDYLKSLK